jgi:hypothetical protein
MLGSLRKHREYRQLPGKTGTSSSTTFWYAEIPLSYDKPPSVVSTLHLYASESCVLSLNSDGEKFHDTVDGYPCRMNDEVESREGMTRLLTVVDSLRTRLEITGEILLCDFVRDAIVTRICQSGLHKLVAKRESSPVKQIEEILTHRPSS